MAESATKVLSELEPCLLQERTVSEWPGTKLLSGTAMLREYTLSQATVTILGRAAQGLYDWCQPSRPEDLVLWRASNVPWLVTIAHERDAYFEVAPAEREALLRAMPSLMTVFGAG